MASRFVTVSKGEILALNESKQLRQQIPGKRQNLACLCLLVVEKIFLLNLQQNHKNEPRNTVN